ncbi:hypothetical protein Tco_0852342 [Tanacetum coccineum]
MKISLQDQANDPALWEVLKHKFEKSSTSNTSCRDDDIHSQRHDDHQEDDAPPKGEKREWDIWVEEIVIDEDEVILEDETPDLITELQGVDKRVLTIYDYAGMKATLNDMLSNQLKNAEEYAYHLEQTINLMENQINKKLNYRETNLMNSLKTFIRSRVIWERVHDFWLGIESYQIKVNLTAPTLTFLGIEEYEPYLIVDKPNTGLSYLNSKYEKRVMYLAKIVNFCNATLEKVLKEVKLKIFQSEP